MKLKINWHFTKWDSLSWYTNQRVTSDQLISLRLAFIARVTSYDLFLLHKLRVTFCIRVTSYYYCTSYKLLFIARFTSYFLHTSYELLFIARITSYILTMSYNKDRDDEVVYDNKVMIKNYSLRSFFDKELGVRQALFLCY